MGAIIRKMYLISHFENEKKLKKFLIKLEKNESKYPKYKR